MIVTEAARCEKSRGLDLGLDHVVELAHQVGQADRLNVEAVHAIELHGPSSPCELSEQLQSGFSM